MIQNLTKYFYLFVLFLAFASCESEMRLEEKVGEIPEVISFSEHIQPILNGNSGYNVDNQACISCHNGGTPPNLTEGNAHIELTGGGYINTDNPESSRLYETMAFGSMRKHTNLTDIAFVLEWITQGAEDN